MPIPVTRELYLKHKDQVLAMATARQRMEGQKMVGTSTDREIAGRLGLSEDQVREIRCLAEMESIDLNWYPEAEEFKKARASRNKR